MKILHVITGMQKAAGTSVFCGEIANGLVAAGHEVVIAVANPESVDSYPVDSRVELISLASLLHSSTPSLHHFDIVHIHALWSPILHKVSKWAHGNNIPVVWSTHGMTAPWSMRHKWWKKLPAWWLYQKMDLKRAAALHCTTDQEVEWNKSLGFNRCFVAPLGTHLPSPHSPTPTPNSNSQPSHSPTPTQNSNSQPSHSPTPTQNSNSQPSHSPTPTQNSNYNTHTLLFVGRIYPVKGLVNLIRAWSLVQNSTCSTCSTWLKDQWKLRIVGPDQAGHLACLKSEVRSLNLESSVEFPGPKFGEELSPEYDNCDCLVLPSFTENFGATVVDAMAHGKPCIASTFTPWKELEECRCGWWVSNAPEALANAIREMIEVGDMARCEMGERARRLVVLKYTWSVVAKKMTAVYEKMLSTGGDRK